MTKKTISEYVRDKANKSGLTAYALSNRAGLDQKVVKRFMDGSNVMSDTLDKLAIALNIYPKTLKG